MVVPLGSGDECTLVGELCPVRVIATIDEVRGVAEAEPVGLFWLPFIVESSSLADTAVGPGLAHLLTHCRGPSRAEDP